MQKTVFSYNPETGEFAGTTVADPSPLESGVWLFPAHSTEIEPPDYQEGFFRVFNGLGWEYRKKPEQSDEAEQINPENPETLPDPAGAFRALQASGGDPDSIFSRADRLAGESLKVNKAYTKILGNLVAGGSWQELIPAVDACLAEMQVAMTDIGEPLSATDINWLNEWINEYRLGLQYLSTS